jgi:hypothetical protein
MIKTLNEEMVSREAGAPWPPWASGRKRGRKKYQKSGLCPTVREYVDPPKRQSAFAKWAEQRKRNW